MAGISGGRYKDFLLQEIMVLGLERRWSAVDTWKKTQKLSLRVKSEGVFSLRYMKVCVWWPGRCWSRPSWEQQSWTWAASWGSGWEEDWRKRWMTCLSYLEEREREKDGRMEEQKWKEERGRHTERPLQWETLLPCKKGVHHRTQLCAHTPVVPGSKHQQHWAGGCVCGLHSASLSPTPSPPSPALSWLPRGPYTSSLRDTGGQKTHRDDVLWMMFTLNELM